MALKLFATPVLAVLLGGAAPPVAFTPVQSEFASASEDYRLLWESDGPRIAESLERTSGLTFLPGRINAIVSEGRPMASRE